jgi:hypothetical protein
MAASARNFRRAPEAANHGAQVCAGIVAMMSIANLQYAAKQSAEPYLDIEQNPHLFTRRKQ